MVRRAETQSFMPGVWVFPGGVVERRRGARARARRASSRRRPGSSSARTPSCSPGRAGSPPRSSRCASTPTSSSPSPPPTRRRGPTAARSTTPAGSPRAGARRARAPASSSSSSRRSRRSRRCSRFATAERGDRGRPRARGRADPAARGRDPRATTACCCPARTATRTGRPTWIVCRRDQQPAARRCGSCFERFITTEYTTVDARQQPITWPVTPYYSQGGRLDRRHHRARLPEEGRRRAAQPAGRAAVLRPDRLRDRGRDPGARPGDRRGRRPRPRRQPGALLARVLGEAAGHARRAPAEADARAVRLVLHADLRQGAPRARLRLAGRRRLEAEPEVHDSHLEEVRSGHTEEPRRAARAEGRRRRWPGTRASTSSAPATRPRCSPGSAPTASRSRSGCRSSSTARRAGSSSAREPAGLPLAEGRACLTAHAHDESFSWQENFQVRGDLVRGDDGWALVPHKLVGGFELPDEGELARYRRNFSKVAALLPQRAPPAPRRLDPSASAGSAHPAGEAGVVDDEVVRVEREIGDEALVGPAVDEAHGRAAVLVATDVLRSAAGTGRTDSSGTETQAQTRSSSSARAARPARRIGIRLVSGESARSQSSASARAFRLRRRRRRLGPAVDGSPPRPAGGVAAQLERALEARRGDPCLEPAGAEAVERVEAVVEPVGLRVGAELDTGRPQARPRSARPWHTRLARRRCPPRSACVAYRCVRRAVSALRGVVGEGLEPGVPGARRVGVEAVLLHLVAQAREQPAGVVERVAVLVGGALAQPPA